MHSNREMRSKAPAISWFRHGWRERSRSGDRGAQAPRPIRIRSDDESIRSRKVARRETQLDESRYLPQNIHRQLVEADMAGAYVNGIQDPAWQFLAAQDDVGELSNRGTWPACASIRR